ncbi:MAG: energy transducer TonB [Spirosomataceae bacterium]
MKKIILVVTFCLGTMGAFAQLNPTQPTNPTQATTPATPQPPGFDKAPEFPGGQAAMGAFLSAKLQGPMNAIPNRIGGQVVVYFDILTDGTLKNFKVQKSLRKDIDDMILKGLKTMPKWKPGTYKGTPVNVTYSLPIMVPPAAATPAPAPASKPKKN